MEIYSNKIFSNFAEVDVAVSNIISNLRSAQISNFDRIEFRINFMLREILNNAVEHGNNFKYDKVVNVSVFYEDDILRFVVKDEGDGIKFSEDKLINDFTLRERNRGFDVIKSFMFSIFAYENEVTITFDLKGFMEEKI